MNKKKPDSIPDSQEKSACIKDEVASGIYFNEASVMVSANDFVMDMIRNMPDDFSEVMARMICTPFTAKLFCMHLIECIKDYERDFGEIQFPKDPNIQENIVPPITGEA